MRRHRPDAATKETARFGKVQRPDGRISTRVYGRKDVSPLKKKDVCGNATVNGFRNHQASRSKPPGLMALTGARQKSKRGFDPFD